MQTHLPAELRWPQLFSPAPISRQLGLSWHNLPLSLWESQEIERQWDYGLHGRGQKAEEPRSLKETLTTGTEAEQEKEPQQLLPQSVGLPSAGELPSPGIPPTPGNHPPAQGIPLQPRGSSLSPEEPPQPRGSSPPSPGLSPPMPNPLPCLTHSLTQAWLIP